MMESWKWSPGKLKIHVYKDEGRHLIKNHRMKSQAVYRDRSGRIVAYDFIVGSDDRDRIEKLLFEYVNKNMSAENGESRAQSIAEITQSGLK